MAGVSAALRDAVHQHGLSSIMGMQQRLFSLWFNSFIYNQIWEDPRVDKQALELNSESRILTIASGGCNVLNYLTAEPAHITAIDLNPYHLSLTRLKIAALKYLPDHESFYDFFGTAASADNVANYERYIKPHLDQELNDFWQGRSLNGRKRISLFQHGLYKRTRFGYFMRLLHWIGRRTGHNPSALLQANTLAEQQAIFEQQIAPFFDNRLVKWLGKLPMSVFSLGIPPQQYKAMKAQGHLIEQYRERVKRLACQLPVQDNYFAWQGFSHSYDHAKREAIPEYLKVEQYEQLRAQLGKVDTHLGSMIEFLAQQPAHSYDRFVFLDAQDWMSDEVLTQLWAEIDRVGKPGTRIVFRTAAAHSPLETALPDKLRARFSYEEAASQQFFQQDRSAIYGGFHLYRKAD